MPSQQLNIKCPKCKTEMSIILDAPQIVNQEKVSMIVFCHSGEKICHCGEVLIPAVAGATNVQVGAAIVPKQQQNNLVQPVGAIPNLKL